MPLTDAELKQVLTERLKAEHVMVEDQSSGCGAKFAVVIVSNEFEGKPLLQRHRLVNEAIKEELKAIHAFSMKTLTPQQWQNQQMKSP